MKNKSDKGKSSFPILVVLTVFVALHIAGFFFWRHSQKANPDSEEVIPVEVVSSNTPSTQTKTNTLRFEGLRLSPQMEN